MDPVAYALAMQVTASEVLPAGSRRASATELTSSRNSFGASVVGRELVISGAEAGGGTARSRLDAFSIDTYTWRSVATMPWTRSYHTQTTIGSTSILIAGGARNGGSSLSTVDLYDTVAGTFTSKADLLAVSTTSQYRDYAAMVTLMDGKAFICGGYGGGLLSSTNSWDPATNVWTARANMPTGRQSHAAAMVSTSQVLVVAGYSGTANATSGSNTATCVSFDPGGNVWTAKTSLPNAVTEHAAVTIGQLVYVFGGALSTGPALLNVYSFDWSTNSWTERASMRRQRQRGAAGYVVDRVVLPSALAFFVGGSFTNYSDTDVYELGTRTHTYPEVTRLRSYLASM